jgi:hypothetical protein
LPYTGKAGELGLCEAENMLPDMAERVHGNA